MKKSILLLALVLYSNLGFCGAAVCWSRLEASEPITFKRQFARVESSPIEITIDELQSAYSIGKKQLNSTINLSSPQLIDIGIEDKTNAQEWSINNQIFQQTDTLEIVSLSTTGYATNFPDSDFALKRTNKGCTNCDEYLFANYQESGIYLDGAINFNKAQNKLFVDSLAYILSSLPITMDNNTIINDTIEQEDETEYIKGSEKRVGFGTCIASDGSSHQVLKSVLSYKETKNSITTYYKIVSFVSDDGYNLLLSMSDTLEVSGKVKISKIDEYLFKSAATSISESKNEEHTLLKIFPNPLTQVLNLEGIVSKDVCIINNLGTKVKEISTNLNTTNIDVSDLTNGIYTLISGNQHIRFVKND